MYKITRIVNNNIVCSEDEKGRELILRGLGIGYGRKKNDEVDDAMVEKIYRISNHSAASKLETLLSSIPYEEIETSFAIIEYAKEALPRELNENIHIILTDHINFALQRHRENMDLPNPLLWETRKYYPTEFAVALHALDLIEDRHHVRLSEDEAGFITLHLVNAELGIDMGNMVQIMEMIHKVLEIVKNFCHSPLDETSIHYERFVTHLKFWGQRLMQESSSEETDDEELCEMVFSKYADEYKCACEIEKYIKSELHKIVNKSEKMYLTIYVKRIRMDLIKEQ